MKWCNKNKEERRKYWTTVPPISRSVISKAAEWCRAHDSQGRFYNHYTNTRWWFEFEKDAILFRLIWGKYESK